MEAIGRQWWFEFRYPEQDSVAQEVITANELHIPVGEPVNVDLVSNDVIHSFWVPKLAGKVDYGAEQTTTGSGCRRTSLDSTMGSARSSAACRTPTCGSP